METLFDYILVQEREREERERMKERIEDDYSVSATILV
jgi:hypothetical protein